MTTWSPDTCDCKIQYDENILHITTLAKCRMHRHLRSQSLLDAAIAYNQSFNLAFGRGIITDEQKEIIGLAKRVTKLKIRLGDFTEEPPTLGALSRLRNFLRNLIP